jgi:hypothetical protein
LLLVSVILLAGCKVDARVDIAMRADGSGTITARVALDHDAVQRLTAHTTFAKAVPLDDVRAAGWKVSVSALTVGTDQGYLITLTHGFTSPADLARRIEDLVGTTGVLRDPTITHTRAWFSAKDAIAVTVDLRDLSTGIRSDAQLSRRLTAAGLDVNALDRQLQSQLRDALTVSVTVHAPGGQSKTVRVTAGKHATVSASTAQTYTRRIELLSAGAALILLALVIMGASLASRSRRRRTS